MGNSQTEISVEELKERLDRGENLYILDVRETKEYKMCHLETATLIPLGELGTRFRELNPAQEIIVHCRSGARSAQAAQFLRSQGFKDVKNLTGGILAWAARIDPTMPRY